MQTIPSFVYLIPVVMLFGVGLTPGVVATIIFALPPVIRLTNLGIRQVGKGFQRGWCLVLVYPDLKYFIE